MKSTITNPTPKSPRPFPKLMIDVDGDIFYMFQGNAGSEEGSGVLIHTNCMNTKTGIYSADWDLQLFQDFEGEVTLSN
jgi:hypothetical protein